MLPSIPPHARDAALLLTLAACTAAPSPAARDSVPPSVSAPVPPPTPPPTVPVAAARQPRADSTSPVSTPSPAPAPLTRILAQQMSGFDEPREMVIRDPAALASAWTTVYNGIPGNAPPAVDFARETVILVALGQRPSGGHMVHVDAIARSGRGAVVRYTATSPGPGCMTTQSLTSPVEVVRTARIEGAVRFDRRTAVQPC